MSKTLIKTVIFNHINRKPHLTFQLSKNLHQVAKLSNASLTNAQVDIFGIWWDCS